MSTDNNPLTYVLTTAKLDATGQRWVAQLSNYNFSIQYKPGKNNTDADSLSRIKWPIVNMILTTPSIHGGLCEGFCMSTQLVPDEHIDGTSIIQNTSEDWVIRQRKDPCLLQVIQMLLKKETKNLRFEMISFINLSFLFSLGKLLLKVVMTMSDI